jgi:hypothetical protein
VSNSSLLRPAALGHELLLAAHQRFLLFIVDKATFRMLIWRFDVVGIFPIIRLWVRIISIGSFFLLGSTLRANCIVVDGRSTKALIVTIIVGDRIGNEVAKLIEVAQLSNLNSIIIIGSPRRRTLITWTESSSPSLYLLLLLGLCSQLEQAPSSSPFPLTSSGVSSSESYSSSLEIQSWRVFIVRVLCILLTAS